MDIGTIYFIAHGIVSFINEHRSQDALQRRLSNMLILIQDILKPLQFKAITNEGIKTSLQLLYDELTQIAQRQEAWKKEIPKKIFKTAYPWTLTGEEREDMQHIIDDCNMLMVAIVVAGSTGYTVLPAAPILGMPTPLPSFPPNNIKDNVQEFWRSCFGSHDHAIKNERFFDELSSWMGGRLGEVARKRLRLRLDAHNTGSVTLNSLQELVLGGHLRQVIHMYASDPQIPLLVWISDNNNDIAYATQRGVAVVQLSSTSAAIAWIKVNEYFLKKHDNAADLRFISDQVRTELSHWGQLYENRNAGEDITKFIRKTGLRAPILICTRRRTLPITKYVESYPLVGSIAMSADRTVYHEYVKALAARWGGDTGWAKLGSP